MKYRKLRIAWSACCGIMCALLVVWWVRSYWCEDVAGWRIVGRRAVAAISCRGRLELSAAASDLTNSQATPKSPRFSFRSFATDAIPLAASWAFGTQSAPFTLVYYLYVPHWFLAFLSATAAVVPWLRWRFSLRTLLIGMTLVAILLGAIVYAVR